MKRAVSVILIFSAVIGCFIFSSCAKSDLSYDLDDPSGMTFVNIHFLIEGEYDSDEYLKGLKNELKDELSYGCLCILNQNAKGDVTIPKKGNNKLDVVCVTERPGDKSAQNKMISLTLERKVVILYKLCNYSSPGTTLKAVDFSTNVEHCCQLLL